VQRTNTTERSEAGRRGARGVFRDRAVAVTGAASGIGRALALRFAGEGARLALLDRDADRLAAVAAELCDPGAAFPVDVADPEAARAAVGAAVARLRGLDVLVNDAGVSHRSRFADTALSVHRRVMDVNFFGAVHCTQAALPALVASRGRIVVVSSVAGFAPLVGRTGYCASKHALHGLFDTLRCELRPHGVSVLLVCPGFTATAIERSALGADGRPTSRPQSRVGGQARPEAVADAIVRAAARRRRLLVLSRVGRTTRLLVRVAPALYERLMTRRLRAELEPADPAPRGSAGA
jgi:NAD(P)-dependent dehydrogenase (short-subunit alcohol dehydrogenase family)